MRRLESRHIGADAIVRGLAAGLIGGLVASWAMNQFMAMSQKLLANTTQAEDQDRELAGQEPQSSGGGQPPESPTLKVARAVSETALGHQLTERERQMAPNAVHYVFGASMGGLYGAAAEVIPAVTAVRGAVFGSGLWLGADELALPALRLTGPPTEVAISDHASALAAHLVYGVVADTVRRMVKATV